MSARWSPRRVEAAWCATNAMLAGAEGDGDWPEHVTREDLEGARARLEAMRDGGTARERHSDAMPTPKAMRGLRQLLLLASADMQSMEPGDLTADQRNEMNAALVWFDRIDRD